MLCDRIMPVKLKGNVYKTVVRPALLYDAATWATMKGQEAQCNKRHDTTMQCNALQCSAVQCNTIQYDQIYFNFIHVNNYYTMDVYNEKLKRICQKL